MIKLPENFVWESYKLALCTGTAVVLLEGALWTGAWSKRYGQQSGDDADNLHRLYRSAVRSNLLHLLVNGPLAYGLVRIYLEQLPESFFLPAYLSVPGMMVCQAFGYAMAHAWMHQGENYHWSGHKYHHQFQGTTFVRPVTANAVSCREFWLAYMAPLVMGVALARPSPNALFAVSFAVSMMNLAIHTPPSILPMADWLPESLFVTNAKHFYHHEQNMLRHYSAPILDMDYLVSRFFLETRTAKSKEAPRS